MERDEVDVERPGSSTPAPRGVDPVTGEREGPRVTPGPLVNCPPSTPGQQHYSLRWNNHQHHLLNAFELLLQNEILVDCTLMCEDAGIRAHRVVLSACSPYFQRLFIDYPGKHPIIVLKDVFFWEMQSILDFMYKGETSVPEAQLTSLIKTAESLKIRGLTSSDQLPPSGTSLSSSPTNLSTGGGYRGYSPSPSPHALHPSHLGGLHHRYSDSKVPHLSSGGSGGLRSTESSPLSLTSHVEQLSDRGTGSRGEDSGRASPVPSQQSNCPRRKQARPRRRSGDSINSSLDLSKPGSPPLSYSGGSHSVDGRDLTSGGRSSKHGDSPTNLHNNHYGSGIMDDTCGPENLSLKRSSSPSPARSSVPPAEHGDSRDGVSDRRRHHSPLSHSERSERSGHPPAINLVKMERLVDSRDNSSSRMDLDMSHDLLAKEREDIKHFQNGIKHAHEQEALQALNFMANSSGLPGHMIPPGPGGHHPVLGHPGLHTPPFPPISSPAGGGKGGSSYPGGRRNKGQHSAPRGGPPRSWTNDDLTKALEMVWNKRMTTSQASRVFAIPYNSLLMYVRGKYGKSLRLDALKKNTPAANDNLNTIGNSRSTPKEKNIKREEAKDKMMRKASKDGIANIAVSKAGGMGGNNSSSIPPPLPFPPMFPFEPPGLNPFGPQGLLPFSPLGGGEPPIGLFGLPNAEFRIKDLMQSMQTLHNQNMLAEGEKLKANLLSGANIPGLHRSQRNSNISDDDISVGGNSNKDLPIGLASLLIKAKEFQDHQSCNKDGDKLIGGGEKKSESGKSGSTSSSAANNSSGISEDMETEGDESLGSSAIKPLDTSVSSASSVTTPAIKIPPSTNEISAQ